MARRKKSVIEKLVEYGLDDPLEQVENILRNDTVLRVNLPAREVLKFATRARSKAEVNWYNVGKTIIADELQTPVLFAGYEWLSFKLPGGEYTPDWDYVMGDGRLVIVEVKTSKFQAGYRDARSKLRAAATLNPWFTFYEAMQERGGFILELIQPDANYVYNLRVAIREAVQSLGESNGSTNNKS